MPGKYLQLFIIAASVSTIYFGVLVIVSSTSVILASASGLQSDLLSAILFPINALAAQNNSLAYMLTIYSIYHQLSLLNEFLRILASDELKSDRDIDIEMRLVARIVDKLCDILETLKIVFSVSNIIYVFFFAMYFILVMYSAISYFIQDKATQADLSYSCFGIVWGLYYSPFIIWSFVVSSLIVREGRKIESSFQKILFKNRIDLKIYRRVELLSLQLEHRHPDIDWGMYKIDWKFLSYLIGLCCSYIVIIVQFEFKGM